MPRGAGARRPSIGRRRSCIRGNQRRRADCSYPWRLLHKPVRKPVRQLVVGQRWFEPAASVYVGTAPTRSPKLGVLVPPLPTQPDLAYLRDGLHATRHSGRGVARGSARCSYRLRGGAALWCVRLPRPRHELAHETLQGPPRGAREGLGPPPELSPRTSPGSSGQDARLR
jgi:hypothetical protein